MNTNFRRNIYLKFGGLFVVEKGGREREKNLYFRKTQIQITILYFRIC